MPIKLDYWKLEELCREQGVVILYSDYLGTGITGRFFPPNIILIDLEKCEKETCIGQYPCIVLLHQICHYYSYQKQLWKKPPKDEQERCFQFAQVMCDSVLNYGSNIEAFKEKIDKFDLHEQAEFLKKVTLLGTQQM